MKHKTLLSFTSFILLFIVISAYNSKALAATITLTPDQQIMGANTSFNLSIDEDSSTDPVNAIQFSLTYPASSFSRVVTSTMNTGFPIQAQNSQGNGIIKIARGAITPVRGKQHIATISFTTTKAVSLQNILIQPTALIVRSSDHKNIFVTSASSNFMQPPQNIHGGTTQTAQQSYGNPQNPAYTGHNSSLSIPPVTIVPYSASTPNIFSIIADFFKHLFGGK